MTTTAEKKRYEFQPKDDEGRNLGRPQVILYDTMEELVEKLTEQNKLVIKEMRSLKKNNRLGILDKEEIPQTASRFAEPVTFKPTELSVDDKIALARDLTDPNKMEAAFDRLTAAKFGAPVEKIREAITSTQQGMSDAQVRQEVQYFLNNTPDYYACKENFDTIYNWMMRYNLEPTRENFTMAFTRLNDAGILLQDGGNSTPVQVEPVVPATPAEPEVKVPIIVTEGPDTFVQPVAPAIAEEPVAPPPYQRINTGLSGTGTSGGGPQMTTPASDITYTVPAQYNTDGKGNNLSMRRPAITLTGLKALDAMPPEVYRELFNTGGKAFKDKVDALEKTRVWNPNQR